MTSALRAGLDRISVHLRLLARTWHLVWAAGPRWALAWGVLLLILGLLPLATILCTKRLVDLLAAAQRSGGGWAFSQSVLYWAGMLVAVSLVGEILQGALDWIRTNHSERLKDHITALVHTKSAQVDLAFYESPDYYDRLYRARDEAQSRPASLIEQVGAMMQHGVTLITLAGVAAVYSPWLLVAVVLAMMPAVFVVARYNLLSHDWWRRTTTERRWIRYYDEKFTTPSAAAELRLFNLAPFFSSAYNALRQGLKREQLRLVERQAGARLLAALGGIAIAGGAMAWMGYRVLQGAATLGDLILLYQVFAGAQSLMRGLTGAAGQVYSHTLFIGNLFDFLDLQPSLREPPRPVPLIPDLREGIRLENVSFHYPGSERIALRHFNLFIPARKVTAIVGPNGAGKSTLIKLMARFYDPDEGRITFDGVDLRDVSVDDVRSFLSILFQMPVRYDASARENIAIGHLSGKPSDAQIQRAAASAGVHNLISSLPSGYDAQLGKCFADGCELSAGEWQRIAMARALVRPAPVILMDEPTSLMDSWAEADWFERIRRMTDTRTVLVITHRFTIARRADLIYVMNGGQIVESGTHDDLLTRNGFYAQSWYEQMAATEAGSTLVDEEPISAHAD